jgi:hypothetical protein
MGWWNEAKLNTFDDRNRINTTIQKLVSVAETLKYAAKLIYQTARGARAMVKQIANSKVLSSFPDVVEVLETADRIALDSPKDFADYCHMAAEKLDERIVDLEEERKTFTQQALPNKMKGWAADAE